MRVHHLTLAANAPTFTQRIQNRRKSLCLLRRTSIANRCLARVVCLLVAMSLLCTSTPAAAKTIVSVSTALRVGFGFWLETSGTRTALKQLLAGKFLKTYRQETQSDRTAKVRRLHITPGEVTARVGEVVRFSAIAYGEQNDTIGGVEFCWRVSGGKEGTATIGTAGDFSSLAHGTFKVLVSGAGKSAETTVKVLDGPAPIKERNVTVKHFSTRHAPPSEADANVARRASNSRRDSNVFQKTSFASSSTSAPAPLPQGSDQYGWNLVNYMTADDPGSQVGDPPGAPVDDGAGNGNFQISAPVLSLAGRGIDISLALTYNSHLWHKAGTNITYDIDRGWPAPGWSFGFGKMADIGDGGAIVVEADGTRHGFNGTATGPASNSSFSGRTNDGSFIDYACVRSNGVIIFGSATLPNGTRVHYGAAGDGAIYPTHIIDPNGNYINITYRNNAGPQIDTVTDTLGRVINFHYNSNNLLTAVTAPPLSGTTPLTLVRLHYQQQLINPGFSGVTTLVRAPTTRWLIDAIYYPATNTGYWFNDTDSFLPNYGTLAKVVQQRNMSHSTSGLTDMGTMTAGTMTDQDVYNWQTTASNPPTYTTLTETWAHMDTSAAVTTYVLNQNGNPRTTTVTKPNGVKIIQYAHNAAGQYNDGMIFKDETYDTDGTTLLGRNEVTWEAGDYNAARPKYSTATSRQGPTTYVTTGTEFTYATSPSFNQATEVRNYDFGYIWQGTSNVLLRKTVTQYENSTNYTNRHIFNLPKIVSVYSGSGTRVSQTEYTYDGGNLDNTPNVVQHLDESDPYAPVITQPGHYITQCTGCPPCSCVPVWIPPSTSSPYKPETAYRGNITQVKTYADAVNLDQTTAVVETRSYDMTGNMIEASSSCCEKTTIDYTEATKYAYPETQTRGSATDAFLQITTSTAYNFNTGLVITSTDANDRPTETDYFEASLRPQTVTLPTGAHIDYAYDDVAMTVTESKYLSGHPADTGLAEQTVKSLNGHGQTRLQSALGAGGVSDFVDSTFDVMGRLSQQSTPYRTGDTKQWTTHAYDGLGRHTRITAPDGSISETYYNEIDFDTSDGYQPARPGVSLTAPGETILLRDAWGRERWGRADALGRLVEIVEPDPLGSGSVVTNGLLTTYSYDTSGNLTGVVQGSQTRSFKYDSLSRLTAQKLAEGQAMLNDSGTYLSSGGTWSDVFTYDTRSNLTSRTDARGVKTVYNYNLDAQTKDPLNRLQSISWDTSGFGDTSNPILAAKTITYAYRTKTSGSQLRDVTQLASITTADVGAESYTFDSEGRVSSTTLTLTSRPSYPFVSNYVYDELNRIQDNHYPAQYGNGNQVKIVHYDYDTASRVSGLTYDSQSFASSIVYNQASQTTSIRVGASGSNQIIESYDFTSTTGLLQNQKIARHSAPTTYLLNLDYDYAGPNGKRTGQLKKILNNLDHNKDRGYSYDAIGRLTQATGGISGALWTQTYAYDRYGNRTSVTASGFSAKNEHKVGPTRANLLAKNAFEPPPFVGEDTKALSDSPLSLFPMDANSDALEPATAPYQGGPPTFTDDPLATGVEVKALHVTQLRDAINLLRQRAGIATVTWAEAVSAGVTIKASHITEMRTRLAEARTALGLAATTYTDPNLAAGYDIKKEHIQEIRDSLKSAWTVSTQISRDGHASLSYDQASNRITTSGFAYDAAGNQVRALKPGGTGSQRYQYDAANRLVKVKEDNNTTVLVTYTYGHSRARLIEEIGSSRTYYVTDDTSTVAEFTESGAGVVPNWSKSYVYLGGRLLSTLTPNGGSEVVEHHHPDQLGTRLVTNAAAGTALEQVKLPFGTWLNSESTDTSSNRRFTSYDRSAASGLDYAVNRQYDSQQGRFTQVDPIAMNSTSLDRPQTLNLYAYVTNDPINNTDSDGLGLKSFFKKLGRIFTAVGNAISKVLNNRWVRIGIFIASFLVGIPAVVAFLGRVVTTVINTVLTIHNILSNIASTLQFYGMLFQGKFKEFGKALGAGIVAAALATIEDSIIQGVKDSINARGGISVENIWTGVKEGFTRGRRKLMHNLFGRGLQSLIPFYGNFCSPGNVDGAGTPPVDANDAKCKWHDDAYKGLVPGVTRYEADKSLFISLFVNTTKAHLTDRLINLAFGTRISGGDVYRNIQIPAFGVLIGYRFVTGRGK